MKTRHALVPFISSFTEITNFLTFSSQQVSLSCTCTNRISVVLQHRILHPLPPSSCVNLTRKLVLCNLREIISYNDLYICPFSYFSCKKIFHIENTYAINVQFNVCMIGKTTVLVICIHKRVK